MAGPLIVFMTIPSPPAESQSGTGQFVIDYIFELLCLARAARASAMTMIAPLQIRLMSIGTLRMFMPLFTTPKEEHAQQRPRHGPVAPHDACPAQAAMTSSSVPN